MSYLEVYPMEEPVSWRAYDRSYYVYDSESYGRPYHSNAIELYVSMCCEECVQKVRRSLQNVDDIDSLDIDISRQKVIVRGHVDPDRILRKVQKQIETATFWDSSYDYANDSSAVYGSYYRLPASFYDYKYYGAPSPSDDYENYSAGAFDYRGPTLIIENYDYYGRSPAYEYSDTYPSSYSVHNNYTYSYPTEFEYPRHSDYHIRRSHDAY